MCVVLAGRDSDATIRELTDELLEKRGLAGVASPDD
jgi:hypothetical protein